MDLFIFLLSLLYFYNTFYKYLFAIMDSRFYNCADLECRTTEAQRFEESILFHRHLTSTSCLRSANSDYSDHTECLVITRVRKLRHMILGLP